MQQLFDSILLSRAVNIWNFIFWQAVVVLVYLLGLETGRNPGIFLQSTARVIVGRGVPLKVVHELVDGLLHFQRHHGGGVILAWALAMQADLPPLM